MALFRRKPRGTWTVGGGHSDGGRVVVRADMAARGRPDGAGRDIQIGIAVPLLQVRADGQPTDTERDALHEIEDEIDSLVAGRATLVAVITTSGMREWVLYTATDHWLTEFQRRLQASRQMREIQVISKLDPDWTVYESVVSDLRTVR